MALKVLTHTRDDETERVADNDVLGREVFPLRPGTETVMRSVPCWIFKMGQRLFFSKTTWYPRYRNWAVGRAPHGYHWGSK